MSKSRILKSGIVKVQIALASSHDDAPALAYFVDRKPYQLPVTPELLSQMGGRPKRYFKAELLEDGITLKEPVPDQFW